MQFLYMGMVLCHVLLYHFCTVIFFVTYMRSIYTGCYAPETITKRPKKLLQCMKNNCQEGCNVKLTFWFCLFSVSLSRNNFSCWSVTFETYDCDKTKSHSNK